MYRALYYGKIETQTYYIYIYIYIYIYLHIHVYIDYKIYEIIYDINLVLNINW